MTRKEPRTAAEPSSARLTFALEQTEAQFQQAVQELATMKGWRWLHIQKALNDRGYWRTPITGSLGPGWPDLVLVRGDRLLFVELKAQHGKITGLQSEVLQVLGAIPGAEIYVWRPSDWGTVEGVLR